ncbi:MAG TPA: tetratricopeptide repeat protein [Chthoniobacterales bacterium]|nr:tetratricopeptide repeat protein [Chthoniobacterales bacterium]
MSRWKFAGQMAVIVAAVVIIYIPAMRAGFVWDDEPLVTKNPLLRSVAGLGEIWAGGRIADYFPLTNNLFWLEYQAFGLNAAGYHIVNVLLQAADAVLIWVVLRRLGAPGAWLAALIFGIHPVHVESVAWISELKNTLSMLFFGLAILAWLEFEAEAPRRLRPPVAYGVALLCFLCACLAKTQVVVLPALLLLWAWWRAPAERHARSQFVRRELLRTLPFFALAAVLSLVTIWFQRRGLGGEQVIVGSFARRLANAAAAVWWYLCKVFAPISLTTVYRPWRFDAPSVASFAPLLALCTAMVTLAAASRRRRLPRAVLAALAYFVLMLLPVLGFFAMAYARSGTIVADHFQYFSDISMIALFCAALSWASKMESPRLRFGVHAVVVLVVTSAGAYSYERAGVYRDEETLWRDNFAKNPDTWQGHNRIGQIRFDAGKFADAAEHFQRAAKLKPGIADNHNALGLALCRLGQFNEGIAEYQKALAQKAGHSNADAGAATIHMNLANALAFLANNAADAGDESWRTTARYEGAIREYEVVLALTPRSAAAHRNLGIVFARTGRIEEAVRHLRIVLELAPNEPLAREALKAIEEQRR